MKLHHRATGCRLQYGIIQCYLPSDTSEHSPPSPLWLGLSLNLSQSGRYSIYLPRRFGGLSGPTAVGDWLPTEMV